MKYLTFPFSPSYIFFYKVVFIHTHTITHSVLKTIRAPTRINHKQS